MTPADEGHVAIAGAGLSGASVARELVERSNLAVTVFDPLPHVAGHCHTERDPETGIMLHVYGPHIFHTHDSRTWAFVNRFAAFHPYRHRVRASTSRGVFALPISLGTLNAFFGVSLTPDQAKPFLATKTIHPAGEPRNFEEAALATVGPELYEGFFRAYTVKQWGTDPRSLPASVFRRQRVVFEDQDAYFDDPFQGIPREGYTALVNRMLEHERIELVLGASLTRENVRGFDHVFFSGAIDDYFDRSEGALGYRTLDFTREVHPGVYQEGSVVNHCRSEIPFTRVTEPRHFTPWESHDRTVILKEFPRDAQEGDPLYYPMRRASDLERLRRYMALATRERAISFIGRLGTYRYLDMHQVIAEGRRAARTLLDSLRRGRECPVFPVDPLG
ncbi:MAG: UDP-galactopyranose/dTDP-fucopyranose mutase family protein [Myxococcota bacterium]